MQHHSVAGPDSDFLRVGECVLEVARRQVQCPQRAATMRITLKSQQVLMVLVAHRGKVVSRETLIESVWPNTLPTDDVLTQAVAQLRKAFCDDREAPRYVETIAKSGYRLLADVSWIQPAPTGAGIAVPEAPPPEALPSPQAPAARSDRDSWRIVLLLVAVAGLLGLLLREPSTAPASPRMSSTPSVAAAGRDSAPDYQRITSQPGIEIWPSLSPDGGQVVYSEYAKGDTSARLMVQATAPVPARALTPWMEGRIDAMPAWSPDGRQIAFTRTQGNACFLLLMPSSGGDTRAIGKCHPGIFHSFSWDSESQRLVASGIGETPDVARSFQVLDIASGAWQPLDYAKGEHDIDSYPVYSPDGGWIAFRRNGSLADVWRVSSKGGSPQRLTHLGTTIFGLGWSPDSRSVVFSAYQDDRFKLLRVGLDSGQVDTVGAWDFDVLYPSVASNTSAAAFVIAKKRSALFSIAVPSVGGSGSGALEPVFPSTGSDMLPAASPDGRRFAFVSNRSAHTGLWWAEVGQPETLRTIEGIEPVGRQPPAWSGDSQRLLVVGRGPEGHGIYEATPALSQVRRLPAPTSTPVRAEYLADASRMLVVADQGGGQLGLLLYDRSTHPWRLVALLEDVAIAKVDAFRNRILFTRSSRPGVWQADLDLGSPRQISNSAVSGVIGGRSVAIMPSGAWLAESDAGCGLRWTALELQGEPPRCLHAKQLLVTGVSYDPGGKKLYFSSEPEENPDIGWVALPAGTDG